ncbi:hypothetical protein [Nocardia sp. NPDC058705]|uniref:hypothetical protein n=1 Tax=Nocardia sp. NPDC058705 TaxID=3346609 RepID=UPI0036AE5C2E
MAAITADANLLQAWTISESRLPDEPVPHEEVSAFQSSLLRNLEQVGTALREQTWCHGPLRRVAIPKKDGGQRVLHIPPLVDRVAERANRGIQSRSRKALAVLRRIARHSKLALSTGRTHIAHARDGVDYRRQSAHSSTNSNAAI